MRLRCISRYAGLGHSHEVGEVFEVTDVLGQQLLNDSPGSFVDLDAQIADESEVKAFDVPPADKAIKHAPKQK